MTLSLAEVARLGSSILDEVDRAVVGKRHPLTLVLAAVLAGGARPARGLPGAGQDPRRPHDGPRLGSAVHPGPVHAGPAARRPDRVVRLRPEAGEFEFRRGPLFTGLMLADEINRTPPKTQAALLEAMQERQVTVEGHTFPLPEPFHVLATANPSSTKAPTRCPRPSWTVSSLRVSFGYPTAEEE